MRRKWALEGRSACSSGSGDRGENSGAVRVRSLWWCIFKAGMSLEAVVMVGLGDGKKEYLAERMSQETSARNSRVGPRVSVCTRACLSPKMRTQGCLPHLRLYPSPVLGSMEAERCR